MNNITAYADWIKEEIVQHTCEQHEIVKDGIRMPSYKSIGDLA